jgi:hypothetical protein
VGLNECTVELELQRVGFSASLSKCVDVKMGNRKEDMEKKDI